MQIFSLISLAAPSMQQGAYSVIPGMTWRFLIHCELPSKGKVRWANDSGPKLTLLLI